MRRTHDLDTCVVLNDIHFPEQDDRAVTVALEVCRRVRPDVVVLNGDIMDCVLLQKKVHGKYVPKMPGRAVKTIEDEVRLTSRFLEELSLCGAEIIFNEGNHEARVEKSILAQSPNLAFAFRSLREVFGFSTDRWNSSGVPYDFHGMTIYHGHRTNIHAGSSELLDICGRVVVGHTHRMRFYARTTAMVGTIWCIENAHLRVGRAEWMGRIIPDWQQGFCVLRKTRAGVMHEIVPIEDGVCVWYGEVLDAESLPHWNKDQDVGGNGLVSRDLVSRVLDMLSQGPYRSLQIADTLSVSRSQVWRVLSFLDEKGVVAYTRRKRGVLWSLTGDTSPVRFSGDPQSFMNT